MREPFGPDFGTRLPFPERTHLQFRGRFQALGHPFRNRRAQALHGASAPNTLTPEAGMRHPKKPRETYTQLTMTRTHYPKLSIDPLLALFRPKRGGFVPAATDATGSTSRSTHEFQPSICLNRWENEGGRWLNHEPEPSLTP